MGLARSRGIVLGVQRGAEWATLSGQAKGLGKGEEWVRAWVPSSAPGIVLGEGWAHQNSAIHGAEQGASSSCPNDRPAPCCLEQGPARVPSWIRRAAHLEGVAVVWEACKGRTEVALKKSASILGWHFIRVHGVCRVDPKRECPPTALPTAESAFSKHVHTEHVVGRCALKGWERLWTVCNQGLGTATAPTWARLSVAGWARQWVCSTESTWACWRAWELGRESAVRWVRSSESGRGVGCDGVSVGVCVGARVGVGVGFGVGAGFGDEVGFIVGDGVGSRVGDGVGMSVGAGEGLLVGSGLRSEGLLVGIGVGFGQMPSSVDEQVEAEALQLVAPQHAKGVGAVQATHNEVPLRSAGPVKLA
eukprot:CAMPEP_0171860930 /NCGR_PEP_ID=MMETSP0992-20121227/26783_1 /TAXON_ID=483369 /ORGANISM="non described non described, Strain CCMP2098" /LENGTH=361 /DNA_ID=CAMNT_0012482861 /DNA_START=766 /DNA_END=1851 /DNA_ORIENTATION=+